MWVDGSFNNRLGNGIGYMIKRDGEIIEEKWLLCKEYCRSSMEIELYALMKVVERILELGISEVRIYGDNKNIVDKINKKYEIYYKKGKSLNNRELLSSRYIKLIKKLNQLKSWELKWIPREENEEAHSLSRSVVGFSIG